MLLVSVVAPTKGEGTSPTEVVGRRLVDQLLKAGTTVRVLAEGQQTHDWPEGTQIVEGSITRPTDTPEVFQGIERVFLAGATATTVNQGLDMMNGAGIQRVVVLSSHGSEFEINYPPETWFWLAIERAVEHSGLPWTHIRPSAVMGSMLEGSYPATGSGWRESIRAEGVVREAYINTGHYPFIHEDDLAGVAAAALLEDGYVGKILEAVHVPISTTDRVRLIGEAIGREIRTEELTLDLARTHWQDLGWPDDAIDVTLYGLQEYGAHREELTRWTLEQHPTVEQVIGRPLRTFEQWAVEHARDFR